MLRLIRSLRLDGFHGGAASADGRRFVACVSPGVCVVLDHDMRQLARLEHLAKPEWVQLNGDGSLLLVGFTDHVEGYLVGGDAARCITLPVGGTSSTPCVFSRDEPVVCIASWDRDPTLAAYDLRSSERIAEHPLPPRGGEGYWLVPHPEGEAMAAIAFSGQSEEWLFWAHYKHGRLRVFERPEIQDVTLPNFDPFGAEFVSHHERLGLCRMRFPGGELLGRVAPEEAFPESPDDIFGYDMHYLGADRVLAWQTDLALYEFDLHTLRKTRRILNGLEGKVFGKGGFFSGQSWMLASGRLLTSDRQFDDSFRNAVLTLRLWDASALRGPTASVDSGRPFTKQLLAMV